MATAVSQLKIQLQGAQTIEQLEQTLEEVNNQIRQVDTNSQAFRDLSAVAQEADAELRTVQGSLEGVTGQEQAESAKRLGEGLAGAFAAATVASSVFGEDTAESVEQATQTALQLVVVLDGLEKASQAFSAETVKGLTSIVSGFRSSRIAATLFGTATRTALTATGIGALIVAIGLLVANWETVSKAVSDFGKSAKEAIDTALPGVGNFIDRVSALVDRVGSLSNLFSALGDSIVSAFTIGEDASSSFFDSLDRGRTLERLKESFEDNEGAVNAIVEGIEGIREQSELLQSLSQGRIKQLEREIELADNQFEKAKLQRELEVERLEVEAERLDFLNLQKELFDELVPAFRENLKNTQEEIEAQKELTEDEEERKILQEEFLKINEQRALLGRLEQEINEEINDIIFQQDILNKNISDEEKERLATQKQLNKELQDALDLIEKQAQAQDKEKFREALESFIAQREAQEDSVEAQERLNQEINDFSENNQIAEENVEKVRLNIFQALRVQQALNAEAKETGRIFATNAEQVEDFKARAAQAVQFIGEQVIQALEAPAQFLQNTIDRLSAELDVLVEDLNSSTERRTDLEENLETAQGRRFDLIKAELREERLREEELADQKIKQEEEIAQAKTQQAKLEKAQAITQATIQTLLAVVEALPNIPLSVGVGIIGAANIAAIASQPIPEFAEGGYTGEGMDFRDGTGQRVAGVVHENEYVIPKHIVTSNPDMVATLEAMRTGKRGFADGGLVPEVSNTSGGLNSNSLINALGKARFQVSVNEFRDVSSEVDVIEDNSSF